MNRIALTGGGYRAGLHLDLLRRLPERFEVTGVLARSAATAASLADRGLPVHRDLDGLLRTRPDVVVVSVPARDAPGLVRELDGRGAHVVTETPPAADLAGLVDLWEAVGSGGRVQVAEQYLLFPHNAARAELVRRGAVGTPTSVQVSSTQTYHATSLVRGLLGTGSTAARVVASRTTSPLADPITRAGWTGDAEPRPQTTTIATFDFGDGRSALYDFTQTQTRNPLRARRLVVRGSTGELVDDRLVRLADATTVLTSTIERRWTGHHQDVQGYDLDHLSLDGAVLFRNPFPGARLSDEEIALATLFDACAAHARGEGPAPYPLAEAAQDHALGLAIEESLTSGGPVTSARGPWA
ncbi:Gfo/Idh/MocA family protein [Kineococcus rhizosphaerae]|uniref:Putative dehydrogenase n=1 Tax=Kineococcus rhizosphaerae TaxID=559628 RepID=A0A2T0R7Z1_9ACTN|nr:Gfo/Idh/MocA family oxidoreductase [Kineococcus rhizosphaerae]PRY17283.1 putative dehydrogenase [Kineococcus rhizosphaerae]